MSIRVDMSSTDLDKQLELLRFYPEVMAKHFRPRMFAAVGGLKKDILPNIPRKTGKAQATFGSKVSGRGINMMGRVGWYDRNDPWYPNVLEHGAKPHDMNTYVPGLSKYIKRHPGLSAVGFMAAGFEGRQSQIENEMAVASEAVVRELAVP